MKPEAFSREGFIVNQHLFQNEPYGRSTTCRSGCGWIALYNYLKIRGFTPVSNELQKALLNRSLFSGRIGTSPFALNRQIKKMEPGICFAAGKKNALRAADAARAGILLYRHQGGIHYAAFSSEGGGLLRFYNAIAGLDPDRITMRQVLSERCLWPGVALWYLPPQGLGCL